MISLVCKTLEISLHTSEIINQPEEKRKIIGRVSGSSVVDEMLAVMSSTKRVQCSRCSICDHVALCEETR
jgi:hypothetical protein